MVLDNVKAQHLCTKAVLNPVIYFTKLFLYALITRSSGSGSSGGIATAYGLDVPGIESRWEARFSAPVQTGPEAHPTSCKLVPGLSHG